MLRCRFRLTEVWEDVAPVGLKEGSSWLDSDSHERPYERFREDDGGRAEAVAVDQARAAKGNRGVCGIHASRAGCCEAQTC